MRQIPHLADKAEGKCNGLPYNTELVSAEGVAIHFWVGEQKPGNWNALQKAFAIACRQRDIVGASWSFGEPTGYWAHANILEFGAA